MNFIWSMKILWIYIFFFFFFFGGGGGGGGGSQIGVIYIQIIFIQIPLFSIKHNTMFLAYIGKYTYNENMKQEKIWH